MSNIVPVFPNGLFTWIDRVDNVSIDFANDINSVASDLISVETTLGTNPQTEANSPSSKLPVTYTNVSARISDAMANNQLPVCRLRGVQQRIPNTSSGQLNNYVASYDPYNMYNGTDITVINSGWWIVTNIQRWDWWGDGFVRQYLTLNGQSNILNEDIIDWAFSGNVVQTSSPGSTPRWQLFGLRPRISSISWTGILQAGDRISVYSENGTSNANFGLDNHILSAAMLRKLPSGSTSSPGVV